MNVQGSPEWLAERWHGVGSSDAPVIAGLSPYKSVYTLWAEKTGKLEPEPVSPETQELFDIGNAMEPMLISLYAGKENVAVQHAPPIRYHPDIPWMLASLDGLTDDRIVECKWSNARDWSDDVPDHVQVQVQHQMAVTGLARADVVGLIYGRLRIVPVFRDDDLIDDLIALETQFHEWVETKTVPPPDASESTRKSFQRLHPRPTEDMLPGDVQTAMLVSAIQAAETAVKQAETERDERKNALRFIIGDHEGIEGDGYRVTYRTNADGTKTDWKLVAAAYRTMLEKIEWSDTPDDFPDYDTIEALHSAIVPGVRVLRVTAKEKG